MNLDVSADVLSVCDVLKELLRYKGMTVADLARQVSLPQPTIQRIVAGTYKHPRTNTLKPIAEYFGLTINQLRGLEPVYFLPSKRKNIQKIPILKSPQILPWLDLGSISHQVNHVITDNHLGSKSYAMYMPDTSMEPIIPKGSILLIDPERLPNHGNYIVVKLSSFPESMVRQLITDGVNHFIKPLSSELNLLKHKLLENDDFIQGVVVEVRFNCE
ncbi:LexA family transcriptional regulator [Legionella septentrionalis]|uniref:LexA family transcriptional regulator n=1 Tax=Legionella septentrionalis TaxID=2498109 RepID=UPI0013156B65|nr:LexA family transcriptional regulator [Legionella septentrionalis]